MKLKVKKQSLILRDSFIDSPVDCVVINDRIAIYKEELYHLPVGYMLLGKGTPNKDLLKVCRILFDQIQQQNIDPSDDMALFGLLISITSCNGKFYYEHYKFS